MLRRGSRDEKQPLRFVASSTAIGDDFARKLVDLPQLTYNFEYQVAPWGFRQSGTKMPI